MRVDNKVSREDKMFYTRTMSPKSWHQRHVDLYEGIIVILIGVVIFGGYFSWKYWRLDESLSSADKIYAPAASDDRTIQAELEISAEQAIEAPRTNPFTNINLSASVENKARQTSYRHAYLGSLLGFILNR